MAFVKALDGGGTPSGAAFDWDKSMASVRLFAR
jgi:hypothetical protein